MIHVRPNTPPVAPRANSAVCAVSLPVSQVPLWNVLRQNGKGRWAVASVVAGSALANHEFAVFKSRDVGLYFAAALNAADAADTRTGGCNAMVETLRRAINARNAASLAALGIEDNHTDTGLSRIRAALADATAGDVAALAALALFIGTFALIGDTLATLLA